MVLPQGSSWADPHVGTFLQSLDVRAPQAEHAWIPPLPVKVTDLRFTIVSRTSDVSPFSKGMQACPMALPVLCVRGKR